MNKYNVTFTKNGRTFRMTKEGASVAAVNKLIATRHAGLMTTCTLITNHDADRAAAVAAFARMAAA